MGYIFDMQGRLACDGCGNCGGVRKRTCPHNVTDEFGHSLPYCPPPALCNPCYAKHGGYSHAYFRPPFEPYGSIPNYNDSQFARTYRANEATFRRWDRADAIKKRKDIL